MYNVCHRQASIRSVAFVLWLVLLGVLADPAVPAFPTEQDASEKAHRVASEALIRITVHDGLLTVRLHGVPVQQVLQEIGRQSSLQIFIDASIDTVVEAEFTGLPLAEGMRALLRGHNFVLIEAKDDQSSTLQLQEVRVYPHGTPGALREERPGSAAQAHNIVDRGIEGGTLKELARQAVEASDPAMRKQAVEGLHASRAEAAIALLLQSLNDEDAAVRVSALHALLDLGTSSTLDALPLEPLLEVMQQDPDTTVRRAALDILAAIGQQTGEPEALAMVEQAYDDPDPQVSQLASGLLNELLKTPSAEATPPSASEQQAPLPQQGGQP